jgi:hypothetical protein
MFQYTPKFRPPAFSNLPKGYELLEVPQTAGYRRPDLSLSRYQFGVIGLREKLSIEDAECYELIYIGEVQI